MSSVHNAHPMIGFFAPKFLRDLGAATEPSLFSRAIGRLREWRNRAVMRQHLLHMDAHMLKDIGLSRSDAQREANKPFWEG